MIRSISAFLLLLTSLVVSAQKFSVDTLLKNGPISKRINLVFLADGYTENELSDFIVDAQNMLDGLVSQSPFREYKNHFNAYAISVPSNVSGAALDPAKPIDNYFGSTFGYAGIERLLVPTKSNKVTAVLADNFPEYDQIFMVVNSTKYGGSGGWIATSSIHPVAAEIAIHEIGHSFAGLRDEYWAGGQYAREESNMTQNNDPKTVRWKNWLGIDKVGIYEYPGQGQGWYKPHQQCKMEYLGFAFCDVCRETITEKILALTRPVISYTPETNTSVLLDDSVHFEVELLAPSPNSINVTWVLDTKKVSTGAGLILRNEDVPSGSSSLMATIFDETDFSKRDNATTYRLYTVTWQLVKTTTVSLNQIDSEIQSVSIFPNPSSDYLEILGTSVISNVRVVDLAGNDVSAVWDGKTQVSVQHLEAGSYFLQFEMNGQMMSHHFVRL